MEAVLFEIPVDERLSLVLPELSYADEIFRLIDNDREHIRTFLEWVNSTTSADDTRANLLERINGFSQRQQASFYGTFDGNFVASVGFISLIDGEGEIGYWLLSQYCGKGLMTAYVRACIDFGFTQLGLQRIIIKCDDSNTKSIAIPERLGFTPAEKMRLQDDKEQYLLTFALEREDWSI